MIAIDGLCKTFGAAPVGRWRGWGRRSAAPVPPVRAVRGFDLHAADGCITGLLGPNGAGKTTALRMLAGLVAPDAGRLAVDGIDVARRPRDALARIGLLSDARGLYPRLTARENIVYFGRLHGLTRDAAEARAELLAAALDLRPLLDRRTAGFSQGERMKTALARALVHDPANVVLDEPTNGLDVLATRALRETLRWLCSPAGGAKCIVFSTHIMQEVERLCDVVVVMAEGRAIARGSVAELCELSGEADFEDAFVRLAFGGAMQRETAASQRLHTGHGVSTAQTAAAAESAESAKVGEAAQAAQGAQVVRTGEAPSASLLAADRPTRRLDEPSGGVGCGR